MGGADSRFILLQPKAQREEVDNKTDAGELNSRDIY
jgi:hypothetical protein